jgi:hypothetical protein
MVPSDVLKVGTNRDYTGAILGLSDEKWFQAF